MKGFIALLLMALISVSYSEVKFLDKCELGYKRCLFKCRLSFPVEEKKYKGCKTRCELDVGLCKTKKAFENAYRGIKDFWSGFKAGKE